MISRVYDSMMQRLWNKLGEYLKIDRSLAYALGSRVWQALASCITMFCILYRTQPTEQGVFYTVSSLANLQIFFELGLSFVILQSTPHYFKSLVWSSEGGVYGSQTALATLVAFMQKTTQLYIVLALMFAVTMIPLGLVFFNMRHDWHNPVLTQAWILLVLGMTLNLLCTPWMAMIEGSGKVTDIYRFRLKQLMIANIAAWFIFFLTDALFIIVVNTWITALTTMGWLLWAYRPFLRSIVNKLWQRAAFSWRKEIWPMQWRIAVSWMSGYFLNQAFIPLLYYYQGAVVSGQMGICLLLANMLSLFSITLITVRSPKMGKLVADGDHKHLDRVFYTAFAQSVVIYVCGACSILGLGYLCSAQAMISRFLPLSEMALLLFGFLFIHITGALALYLRAHRVELFAPVSVIGAVLTGLSTWFGAAYYGSLGVVWSIVIINICYGFPSALWLWLKFKGKKINESKINYQYSNMESS